MDIDRYLATHRPDWERLEKLANQRGRKLKALRTGQITEMVELYQKVSADLSYVRTHFPEPGIVAYLTKLVSKASSTIYGTKPRTWRNAANFFTTTFPVAIWRVRYFVAVSALLFLVPAFATGIWIANSPQARDAVLPEAARQAYIENDFEEYYASETASQFSSQVFTNNALVGIGAFAGGIFLCIPTVFTLILNGANVGFAAGLFTSVGEQAKFWGLISPHGLLEITAVLIAGAAGLQVGWALIDPGDRTRYKALALAGQRSIAIVLGLVVVFAIAGLIEGFVTGQPWPTWLRVGIGAITWVTFLLYVFVLGRKGENTTV